jgi:2-keto-4-pentenoate hydratase
MSDSDLIDRLAAAQRNGVHDVDAQLLEAIDRDAAYRIEAGVMHAVGETAGMYKTAVHPDGVGVAAPIFASRVGAAPGYRLPVANVTGLEVEVGLVLSKDVASGADVRDAIDHYFLGVEICGTRYIDRTKAGTFAGLADSMSALGYAIGPRRDLGDNIDGFTVELEFAGKPIYSAPAKHGFGTVLASLVAYADSQYPAFPLKAGTIITTGSMCGLVPTSGTGHVVARFGELSVEFDIV